MQGWDGRNEEERPECEKEGEGKEGEKGGVMLSEEFVILGRAFLAFWGSILGFNMTGGH